MLEECRRMTPKQRFAEMRALMDVVARVFHVLPPEERARRLAAEGRIRRASREAPLQGLAAAESARRSCHAG